MWSSSLQQKSTYCIAMYPLTYRAASVATNGNVETQVFLGEYQLYFHEDDFSKSYFYLNLDKFPNVKRGEILFFKVCSEPIYFEVIPNPDITSNIAISIRKDVGKYLNLTRLQSVSLYTCPREDAGLDSIEVNILDGCLPRHEIWSLLHSLRDQFVYRKLAIEGYRITVENLRKGEDKYLGGLITSSTNVYFRRSNCRMYIVIHITREILTMDPSGYLRGEIITDYCLKKLQDMWRDERPHHIYTVMIYASMFVWWN